MKSVEDKYIIAVDMDGTLLNSRGEITARTKNTLQKLLDMGHYVTPASGRPFPLLPEAVANLKGISYAVLENGAIVWDWKRGETISKFPLPAGMPSRIIADALHDAEESGKKDFLYFEFFADGIAYSEEADFDELERRGIDPAFKKYMGSGHRYLSDLPSHTELLDRAEKLNVFFSDGEFACEFRRKWNDNPDIYVTTSVALNAEFNAAGVDKGSGLLRLMGILKVPMDHVIAIGDNDNDIEMFEAAGHAVAMGNASEPARAAADYLTEDNDHDGAAVFLEKFFELDKDC